MFQETVVFLQVLGRIIGSRGEKGGCSGGGSFIGWNGIGELTYLGPWLVCAFEVE